MVAEIIVALRRSAVVKDIDVIEALEEESVQFLRVKVEMIDGSVLHIRELVVADRSKYSYQWQTATGETLLRWDNAPHHREITTHPDHKHALSDHERQVRTIEWPTGRASMNPHAPTVTLLFTDLVNSTVLLQRVGDEQAQRIFQAHHKLLRDAVAANGGHAVKWLGDGLMVAFPSAADGRPEAESEARD